MLIDIFETIVASGTSTLTAAHAVIDRGVNRDGGSNAN
jgi:hypothetical protein